ncbi:MAG: hypothetical protein KBS54_02000, partial [Synergistaceae bacterium]|nr:hypothetical protein [Candidatus Equadaptatus faecalis]
MPEIHVAVPGPWWTALSYNYEKQLQEGVRVKVPLGKGMRVGIVVSEASDDSVEETKNIAAVIDDKPVISSELWETIKYFGANWFTGTGSAAKCLLPAAFFDGEETDFSEAVKTNSKSTVKYFYEPRDEKRYEQYISESGDFSGTLFLFPEVDAAKAFWKLLPEDKKAEGMLFPSSNPKKQWECWKSAKNGECRFVIGSPAAAFVPLKGLSRIVVDEEESGAWLTQKYPIYHLRSLLAVRARFAGAQLWLGGRFPSSKAAAQNVQSGETQQKRIVFVDLHDASAFELKGLKDGIAISRPLLRETIKARKAGKFALWLLDRKGFAGEIFCDECGEALHCKKCGGTLRWEAKKGKLVCLGCASETELPECCPVCGGRFLEGVRPGLEALYEKALPILQYCGVGEVLLLDGKLPSAASLLEKYPSGAVIIGTRKILSLASSLDCGMAGWADVDAEARGENYDAKERAFGLVWESVWRGKNPDERAVVVQSRMPGRGWQEGLKRGWGVFWKKELQCRREFEFPPFVPMLEIQMPKNSGRYFEEKLEQTELEFIEGKDSDNFFVRTKKFAELRKILEPYYNIKNTRRGMPKVFLKLN